MLVELLFDPPAWTERDDDVSAVACPNLFRMAARKQVVAVPFCEALFAHSMALLLLWGSFAFSMRCCFCRAPREEPYYKQTSPEKEPH